MPPTDEELADLERLRRDYSDETDEEIERKRKVIRSMILAEKNLDHNERWMEVLSSIVRKRQRRNHFLRSYLSSLRW
jgi:hypothetical protein